MEGYKMLHLNLRKAPHGAGGEILNLKRLHMQAGKIPASCPEMIQGMKY